MAFVSGGGGGLPPQPGVPAPGGSNGPPVAVQTPAAATQLAAHQQLSALAGNQHFLDALLQQQLQQQQQAAAQANTPNPSSQLVSHLLASALLGGSNPLTAVNQMASGGSSSTVEPQGMQLLSVLQNQLAFGQLLPQFQSGQNLGAINPLLNPAIALYYQQLLQQQQQQQQTLLQQLAQQQIPQAQAVQVPQAHAFQPPAQVSSGNVEAQLNAQERLMNAYLSEQQQQAGPFNIPAREQEQALMNHQVASGSHPQHVQHHHDRTSTASSRNLAAGGSGGVDVESVEEKISRLISENEAIVQPHQTLLKRRPYHRQAGGQSSIDHDSNSGGEYGSTRTSPGIRDHRMLQSSSRSQSHYEPLLSAKAAFGGSLTSGLPINRNIKQESLPTCSFCLLTFPNEAGLQVHEIRCSKKVEAANAEAEKLRAEAALALQAAARTPDTDTHSRHPLKRRLLAAVAAEQHSPTKIPRPESRDIVVIEERKASVVEKKEPIIELDVDHPGLPRRATLATISLSQQRGHSVAAPIAVCAIPSVMQPVPHAPAPVCALQTAGGSSAFVSPTGSAFVPQPAPASQIPKKEENPFSIDGHVLDGNTEKPYTLVLTQACKVQATTDVATVRRSRGRNITSETFVCMHRAQPMFVEQKGNLSMYSNWHQVNINETESKLNLLYMGMCSTRPRTGVKPFWRYSVANRDHGQYKMTHSSFWEYRNKVRRQAEQLQTAKEENEDDLQPFLDGLGNDTKPAVDEVDLDLSLNANDVDSSATIGTADSAATEPMKEETDAQAAAKYKQTSEPTKLAKSTKKQDPVIGGYRTDEVYVYVRGRGRGRYVCDRCGIRCKKPSMLNKHIKSHTDIRPYKCKECNFSFKTKGNWTKHLSSKTHRRRLVQGSGNDSDNEDGLVIASPDEDGMEQRFPFDEMDSILDRAASSDDEADDHLPPFQESTENPYRKFGQENILLERAAHTPPSRWVLVEEEVENRWPEAERARHCSSAPPSAISPTKEDAREEQVTTSITASIPTLPLPTVLTVPSTSFVGQQPQPQQQQPQTQQQPQQQNFAVHQPTTPVYPYLSKEESMKCNQCDRSFRKASELTLHQYTHDIEKHHARNRMFQCPECRIPLRTKALLAKHLEASHGSHIDDSVTASIDPCASTQSVLGGSAPIASNPRSFVCSDCNIGFRKHGILAKHLRSKTHVMKLETLKRLPEDSLSLITKRDNGACLNGVDTTDCEKARKSLYEIVETIRAENQRASMQMAAAVVPSGAKPAPQTVSDGLECREQLAASPAPIAVTQKKVVEPVLNGQRSEVEENLQQPRPLTEPATTTAVVDANNLPRNRCDPTVRSNSTNPPRREDVSNIKLVSANVWIPPRAEERSTSSRESNNIRAVQEVVAELREDNEAERSTCSSPVLRILNSNGHAASPLMPQGTKCQICGVNADSPIELQVHLYSDHISIRDGKDLKCPKRHCDKVYPNKESLRLHIIAHYQQRVDATPEAREDDSVSSVTSAMASRLAEDVADARGSPMSDASDGSWPSPASVEVSRAGTASETKKSQDEEQMSLPCTLCNKTFNDAVSLQQHWFGHVSSRIHVCQVCDAGFTTSDALAQHSLTHSSAPPTR